MLYYLYERCQALVAYIFVQISANEGCERIVSAAVSANIIIYLTKDYKMGATTSAVVLFAYQAASSFLPIVGAIVSDAFLGRYLTITLTLFACTIVSPNQLPIYKVLSI